jgi:hypothetical protein
MEVRSYPYVDVCDIYLTRIGPVVGDVGGEVLPTEGNLRFFGVWRL